MNNSNQRDLNHFINNYNSCQDIESILPPQNTIVALGDLHGDYDALIKSLIKAKLIDNSMNWIGKDTHLVQVGDIFDRGGRGISHQTTNDIEEIKILDFLYNLNKQAIVEGGKVISLIGNHELMNILGDFRYASKEHIQAMGGYNNRRQLMKPGGIIAKKIACNSLGIVKIGDWIFVHGGLLPEHILQSKSFKNNKKKNVEIIYEINYLVKQILLGNISTNDISQYEENILFGGNGVFWTRKYSGKNQNKNRCDKILETLNLLEINPENGGIVVGHTPQSEINSICNNNIWRIDTGMSNAFGKRKNFDRIEILKIINNGEKFIVI